MKVGIKYLNFYDCSSLVYALAEGEITVIKNKVFKIGYQGHEYVFSQEFADLSNVDKTVILLNDIAQYSVETITNVKKIGLRNYKFLQTQLIENYHCPDEIIKKFLEDGNIILSSATINFTHNNFIHDPFFNLFYLYNNCGYKYINYHKSTNKNNLMGIYYRPLHVDGSPRTHRTYLYEQAKNILSSDLICYSSNEKTDFDKLIEQHNGFGFWSQTYISTYTDYATSVCNIMFETINAEAMLNINLGMMYNREYITEKTLQSLLYSKEDIFFIWYGPKNMLNMLKSMGFWFLNFEFYDENEGTDIMNDHSIDRVTPVEKSVIKAIKYIKQLKEQFKDNNIVHDHLLSKYGHHLKNNSILLDNILKSSTQKEKILELIRK